VARLRAVNSRGDPVIGIPSITKKTEIPNCPAMAGAETLKVNTLPSPEPPTASGDSTTPPGTTGFVKSETYPVMLPFASATVIVHETVSSVCTIIDPVNDPMQLNCEALVGRPTTVSVCAPSLNAMPLETTEALMLTTWFAKNPVAPSWMLNVMVRPPSLVLMALLDSDKGVVAIKKSLGKPVVLPPAPLTNMVQSMNSLVLTKGD